MKKKILLTCLLLVLGMTVTGCKSGAVESGNEEAPVTEETQEVKEETGEEAPAEETAASDAEVGRENPYIYEEYVITFPDDWEGRYVVVPFEDGRGVSVMQKMSYDINGSGVLFSVWKNEGPAYDLAGAYPLAYTETEMYFIGYPTDVPYCYDVEGVAEDYEDLSKSCEWIRNNIAIAGDGLYRNADEYTLPMSEFYPLTEMDIINLDDDQLMIARNEIYARHGYHFNNEYWNLHFDSFSWYQGQGDSFDESQLSQVEKDNIALIKSMEEKYAAEHPYPIEHVTGKIVDIDLDEDGTTETLTYKVEDSMGFITVDDITYSLEEFDIYMVIPDEEHFYITDISPFFEGLEIAVTDDGASDDPVTHFFVYDGGELVHIGTVLGYPMKQKAVFNGFIEGGVQGYGRTTLLETCEYYNYYWYNYDEKKLELQDTHHMLFPKALKTLNVELQVYTAPDMDAPTVTMIPQSGVCFVEIIDDEWVLVRAKDYSKGYVHVTMGSDGIAIVDNVNMRADEVFGGLMFYD